MHKPASLRKTKQLVSLLFVTLAIAAGCRTTAPVTPPSAGAGASSNADSAAILSEHQRELLALGFSTATAIPIKPHLKSRSLAQRQVVGACLDLDQPELAEEYARGIGNWRRGTAHADIALYYARHDAAEKATEQLDTARQVMLAIKDWHVERIRARMARAYKALGKDVKAENLMDQIEEPDHAGIRPDVVENPKDKNFENQLETIKKLLESEQFDTRRNGLYAAAELFNIFYSEPALRQQIRNLVENSWEELPPIFRIEVLFLMAEYALDHGDTGTARNILADAKDQYRNADWRPEHGVPVLAKLARLTHLAGKDWAAKRMINKAERIYTRGTDSIGVVFRVRTFLRVAEALHAMNRREKALQAYSAALEEGAANINARPRAEDLTRICVSMAGHNVEPTPELWSRLREVAENLDSPW